MKLKLSNVNKKYFSLRGEITALKDINLEIRDKEFFVLLGPSGCGKSTLLNILAGLERPSQGEISFDDKIVVSQEKNIFLTPRERNIAFVFQSYALYPHLSVFDNIAFPLSVVGINKKEIEKTVRRTASILEISSLLSARPAELSGGQRQRVAIARAIVRQPNIFLLDEPLSNLDAQLRVSMRTELKNLQRELGITTVYVTHDQIEAMSLGDRVAVLRDGTIEQTGPPRELYENPVNPFVARFIGTSAMNLLTVTWVAENSGYFVILGNKRIRIPQEKTGIFNKLKNNKCIFGIRPEDIYVTMSIKEDSYQAKVNSIENLGRDVILHISLEGYKLSIYAKSQEMNESDTVYIGFDLSRVHIFETV